MLVFVFAATAPDLEPPPTKVLRAAPVDGVSVLDDSTGRALDTFWRFAGNALVMPLIDDTDPPRWSNYMIEWICDGRGRVTVDGRPLPDGQPIASGPFAVRWDLERCAPFAGTDLLLDGVVGVAVTRNSNGFSAQIISPVSVETPAGRFRIPVVAAAGRTALSP